MECAVALDVRHVHVGVIVEQEQQRVLVAVKGSVHQSRLPLAVLTVDDVRAAAETSQEGLHDKRVSSGGCQVQRCPVQLVSDACALVITIVQKVSDTLHVTRQHFFKDFLFGVRFEEWLGTGSLRQAP